VHAVLGTKVARLSVSQAYDAIAAGYDEEVRGDDWMRRKLHAHYRRVFSPGDRVLDVGCGTGIDASFLARQGISVVGIDASSEMIGRMRARLGDIDARVLRIEELSRLGDEPFDGIISAFAGLNSVANLAGFANDAAALVRPGGRMVVHMLNRFSLWEWLGHVRQRQWRAAASVGKANRRRFVIGGQSVEHQVYFPSEAYAYFRTAFQLRGAYGLGALRPPHTVRRLPLAVVSALEHADVSLGSLPLLRNAGRFFVLDLERRRTA
jgi:2-polyprenyl-3-methyl-5-hydroxy-6-metoxy-1,4-benzoquinol methylase